MCWLELKCDRKFQQVLLFLVKICVVICCTCLKSILKKKKPKYGGEISVPPMIHLLGKSALRTPVRHFAPVNIFPPEYWNIGWLDTVSPQYIHNIYKTFRFKNSLEIWEKERWNQICTLLLKDLSTWSFF